MATVDDIRAQLILDTQKWKQGVDQSKKDANDLGNTIRKQKDALQEFGVASAAAFAVLSLGVTKATQEFAKFDQELANLRSVTRLTADQLQEVKSAAMQFGPEFGRSAAVATDAVVQFGKAGYDVSRLAKGELAQAMSLIISGEMDAGDAAAYAANSLNIYKKENLSLKQVADVAVGAANASSTSVKEMADANRQLGAVAAQVGFTFQDVNTEFALMAQNGLRGQDGATSMKTALIQLASPTKQAQAVMKDLGLEFFNSSGQMKSFSAIGEMLRDKLGRLNDQSKLLVLSTVAGSDGIRFLSQLSQTTTQDFQNMTRAMGQFSAEETAKTKLDSITGSMQKMRAEIGVAADQFAQQLAPVLSSTVSGVSALTKSYNELSPSTKGAISSVVLSGTAMTGAAAGTAFLVAQVIKLKIAMQESAVVAGLLARTPLIAALTALAGVASFVFIEYQRNAQAARDFAAAQTTLNRAISDAPMTRDSSKFSEYQKQADELDKVVKKYDELKQKQAEVNASGVTPGKYSVAALFNDNAKAAQQLGAELDAVKKRMEELGVTTADYKTKAAELRNAIYANARAVLDNNKADIDHAVQIQDSINKINESAQVYRSLADQENLSAQQKEQLAATVKTLTDLIPGLNAQEMENGKVIVTNTSLIGDKIRALMQEKGQAVDTANTELAAAKAEAEGRIASYTAQIQAIQALAAARNALVSQGVDAELPDNFYRREQSHLGSLNDGVSVAKANIAEIEAALGKITNGTGYAGPSSFAGTSGGGGSSYSIPDTPKKGGGGAADPAREAEQAAREADQAMQERFQRELDAERHRYQVGEQNAGEYAARLQAIRGKYYDWLQQHENERFQLEEQTAQLSFQHSSEWIANERKLMEDAGKSEESILEMELAAWERVSARKIYLIEDQKKAQDELRRVQQALVSEMETQLKKARELDAQESIADAESRYKDAEKSLEDRYKSEENVIQAKIDALNREADAKNRLLEYERERAKLSELQTQRDAIAADKRFDLIERDASGNLVRRNVADLSRLTEIDKQIGEQRERIADMQREDETRARREALDKELRDKRDAHDKDITDIRIANDNKMRALRAYWDAMTSQEKITSDLRESIAKNGMENTLRTVGTYLDEMVRQYNAAQAAMRGGVSLPGLGGNSQRQGDMDEMAQNSAEWHNASEARRRELEARNQELGHKNGGTYDPNSGKWKFHTGIDRVPGALGSEVPSILQAGERVLSIKQNSMFEQFMQSALSYRLPAFNPSFAGAGVGGAGGKTTNIYGDIIVKANDYQEFIESVRKL